MRKLLILLIPLLFSTFSYADSYYFKGCKLSNVATGEYIINLNKKIIEVTLMAADGRVQTYSDPIKKIEKDRIVTEKIESGKGDNVYFEYYLNLKSKKVVKLQYDKQSGPDMDIFKIREKKESKCTDVKGGWDKNKIEKAVSDKEQKQRKKAQEQLKKEENSIIKCQGDDHKQWTNCKGSHKAETGHKYEGIFKVGEILKGVAFFPGGAKYIGEFKNFKPHGFGNFSWTNGDKYFGEWKNGKSHGNGTKIWSNGREYSGKFENDKLHGNGTFYYPDGKKYVGEYVNGKRHGEGTFTYPDGTAYIGKFVAGIEQGVGECIGIDGSSTPCSDKTETQNTSFTGKDTRDIEIVSKKWVRISQYETNSKKGKKVMDKLKSDFEIEASEICSSKGNYKVLKKTIEVLDLDETPAYGLETKLQLGISGVVECIS